MNLRRHGIYAVLSVTLAAVVAVLTNLVTNGPTWPLAVGFVVFVTAQAVLEYRRAVQRNPGTGALDINLKVDRAHGRMTVLDTDTPPQGDVNAKADVTFLGPLARLIGVRVRRR